MQIGQRREREGGEGESRACTLKDLELEPRQRPVSRHSRAWLAGVGHTVRTRTSPRGRLGFSYVLQLYFNFSMWAGPAQPARGSCAASLL